jgi:hypothetical protein
MGAYRAMFGPDRWAVHAGDWTLLGFDAQFLGSGSAQESALWHWLDEQASRAGAPPNTAVFLHRPLYRPRFGESFRMGRYVAASATDRLLNGPLQSTLRLVVSGHTHQYLDLTNAGVRHLWVPSTAFILPDHFQSRIGEKVVGIGLLELAGSAIRFDLWCPDGMTRHDVSALSFFHGETEVRSIRLGE